MTFESISFPFSRSHSASLLPFLFPDPLFLPLVTLGQGTESGDVTRFLSLTKIDLIPDPGWTFFVLDLEGNPLMLLETASGSRSTWDRFGLVAMTSGIPNEVIEDDKRRMSEMAEGEEVDEDEAIIKVEGRKGPKGMDKGQRTTIEVTFDCFVALECPGSFSFVSSFHYPG